MPLAVCAEDNLIAGALALQALIDPIKDIIARMTIIAMHLFFKAI